MADKPRIRVPAVTIKAAEGEVQPGPWLLPVTGGWLPVGIGDTWNWWQRGFNVEAFSSPTAVVGACVAAYSQTVAMCPGDHWKVRGDGGRDRVTTSALARILKAPNSYQTISDFMLNITRCLYEDGNAYALALRNNRFEITELHLMNPRSSAAMMAGTGDIFYNLSGNIIVDHMLSTTFVPARDVLHIKLHTYDYNPLRGISPLVVAAKDVAANNAMLDQQISFYMNQARPSTVLSTDMILDATQVQALRDRWDEQSRGLATGGTPILTAGLKPVPLGMNSVDAQLAEIMKMSEQHIALAYRIPLAILGIGNTNLGSTEALMQGWLSTSLGFCLNHIEEAFGRLFGLGGYPDEYMELNTDALLRSAFKERVDSFARGVQGGIFEPNYARAEFGLPAVEYGDEPRVQQQVVPLSAAAGIPTAPGPASQPSAARVEVSTPKDFVDVRRSLQRRFRSSLERQQQLRAV
jgi:HK97 family phage portal protein